MKKQDLIKLLNDYPAEWVKVAESKKHNDNAPTMNIVDTEVADLQNYEEPVILLWIEPSPETISNCKEERYKKALEKIKLGYDNESSRAGVHIGYSGAQQIAKEALTD